MSANTTATKAINYYQIFKLAVPIILANIAVPILNLVNTGMMGHLNDAKYIGALALGITTTEAFFASVGFLRMSTIGLSAQAYGAKNHSELVFTLFRNAIIAVGIGVLVFLLKDPISYVAANLFNASEEVEHLALTFFKIRSYAIPAAFLNITIIGWLFGIQKTKEAFYIRFFNNCLTIALGMFFVLKQGMNVDGIAYAVVISDYCSLALACFITNPYLSKYFNLAFIKQEGVFSFIAQFFSPRPKVDWQAIRTELLCIDKFKTVFKLNFDIFLRNICLYLCFSSIFVLSPTIPEAGVEGKTLLAANSILFELSLAIAYALDGFAFACEMLVGESIGAQNIKRYKTSVWKCGVLAVIFAGLFSLTYWLAGPQIISTMTDIDIVNDTALRFMPWLVLFPIAGVWSYQLDGIFTGAMQTKEMRNTMALAFGCYILGVIYIVPHMGNNGLWLSLIIYLVMRALGLWVLLPNMRKQSFSLAAGT